MFDLSFIWAGIIVFAVLTYVILDGFDLGVGILFPFASGERDKAVMMNSIAPIWDGNETWLVLGGGGLFAVFPLVYAVVMPALYMPITLMLLALIFRGVAFECRWRTKRWKPVWDAAFFGGSLIAAFMQGIALGALGFIGVVSVLTPFQDPVYFNRWFNLPGSILSLLMPGALAAATWALFAGLNAGKDGQPFFAALTPFVLCFIGIGISFYPHIVPPGLTIAEAAAPDASLKFALVGTVVLVPLILGYTAYAYWVFRGKVDPEEGYH